VFAWRALLTRNGAATPGAAAPGAYLTVPALHRAGIRVAFTTRHGGFSDATHASLNLSYPSGDDPSTVRRNRARVLDALGLDQQAWTGGKQVHGAGVARVTGAERGAGAEPGTSIPDVDALWTDEPGIALTVRTADCVPIVVVDPSRPAIAAIHAGWRGLVAGVVEAAVEAMGGGDGTIAFVGPSIGPCCYEVGEEVAEQARAALGDDVVRVGSRERPHVDLWRGTTIALRRAGLQDARSTMLCTRCEPHRFYSHRAGDTGRQALVATIAGAGT